MGIKIILTIIIFTSITLNILEIGDEREPINKKNAVRMLILGGLIIWLIWLI